MRLNDNVHSYIESGRMYMKSILSVCDFGQSLLAACKELPPKDASIDVKDKFIGGILGVAIGDAFARPTEGMTPDKIKEIYGEITNYVKPHGVYHPAERMEAGYYSDDTFMTLDVARCLIEYGYINPDGQMYYWGSHLIRGAGRLVLKALYYYRYGHPWYLCGVEGDYNGGAMRAVPVGLMNHQCAEKLKMDAILSCWPTHISAKAISGTIIQSYAAGYLVNLRTDFFDDEKNIELFIKDILSSIEGIEEHKHPNDPKTVYNRIGKELPDMLTKYDDINDVVRIWNNGVNIVETISCVLFLFLKSPLDFKKILLSAANAGGDSDSIASMACGLCGALIGYKNIPGEYIKGLEKAQEIIDLARRLYDASVEMYQ